MTSVAASSSSPSSSSIVVLHIDTSDMRPILKEAFGKNVEIATISNNGSIPAKYFYEGLQNYIEGIVANHSGAGGDDDEDAQRTADGVTAIKKKIGIILKEILNDNLRTALTPFDRDGDGTIDAEELQQAAKDHQTVLMSRKILAWFSFALLLFMVIVCGGLSVGIYYIVFSMKDTYVNPSTGLMMVKAPDGSTDTNTAGIGIELPTKTVGQGVTIPSQGTMGGRTCYSSDSVANMFVNVATGVTTSLAETNQDTDELHIYHLGNSDCDESNIVWSNKDVQLGCVVMVPSLECTNMVRRGRYLSEFADTDTDAMQDRHRSLKEHVANTIVGAAAGGQHGTTIDRSNRILQDNDIAYINANDIGSNTAVTWKKYDKTDCKGAHTRIDGSKYFGGSQRKWQTEYTVDEMLAACKSKCANNEACVAFNFRDNREHPDYPFGGSSCKWWSTITDTPDAAGGLDSKDCWVSSKSSFGQTPNPTPVPTFAPSSKPSGGPSGGPSNSPSSLPSSSLSTNPTTTPTPKPTFAPTTQPPTTPFPFDVSLHQNICPPEWSLVDDILCYGVVQSDYIERLKGSSTSFVALLDGESMHMTCPIYDRDKYFKFSCNSPRACTSTRPVMQAAPLWQAQPGCYERLRKSWNDRKGVYLSSNNAFEDKLVNCMPHELLYTKYVSDFNGNPPHYHWWFKGSIPTNMHVSGGNFGWGSPRINYETHPHIIGRMAQNRVMVDTPSKTHLCQKTGCPPGSVLSYAIDSTTIESVADVAAFCLPCVGSTTTTKWGARSCEPCVDGINCTGDENWVYTRDCLAGTYCGESESGYCEAGYYCPAGSVTKQGAGLCEEGYYCPAGSATKQGTPCPEGYYCPETYLKKPCDAGYHCPAGSTSIQKGMECEAGYYCPAGAPKQRCKAGFYCPAGSSTSTGAGECKAGYYCPDGSSTKQGAGKCEAGYYCLVGSATSSDFRRKCEHGYYCPAGSSDKEGLGRMEELLAACATSP